MPAYFPVALPPVLPPTLNPSTVNPPSNSSTPNQPLSVSKQRNLWGQTIDPHRVDLYYVDFDEARAGVEVETGLPSVPIIPQHIQSITLPENQKVRAEPIRRESIAYQMPSWDEPLEPIVASFILEDSTPNPVITMLEQWSGLVRAGRGLRTDSGGFPLKQSLAIKLNANFRTEFRFNIHIFLLQGSQGQITATPRPPQSVAQSQIKRTTLQRLGDALKKKKVTPAQQQNPFTLPMTSSALEPPPPDDFSVLNVAKTWTARVWLSGYKVTDLNYTASGMVLVTATFQTEYLNMQELT